MRLIGLVILLAGLVLVASVTGAIYGLPLMAVGLAILLVRRWQHTLARRQKMEAARQIAFPDSWQPTAQRAGAAPRRKAVRPRQAARRPAPYPQTDAAAEVPPVLKPRADQRRASTAPRRKVAAPARADREPAMGDEGAFRPLYDGEENRAPFANLRVEISSGARAALTALQKDGFNIRAHPTRVTATRDHHTEILRSNAAIVDFARQMGLMGE
jgi:hypothetical protein